MNFTEHSYQRHESHWREVEANPPTLADLTDPERETADQWRHRRMFEPVKAFLHRPDWSWLTVGDGRYGSDSIRIRDMGVSVVLPTDIGGSLLESAKKAGLITDYRIENAESMTFKDSSFDIVFCKESYHHFPRPPVALYEMVRISRRAVILIEPRDYAIDRGPMNTIGPAGLIQSFGAWLAGRLGIQRKPLSPEKRFRLGDEPHFEESGNYMYSLSAREIEKVALGLNLPAIAVKGLNDYYIPEATLEPASQTSPVFRKMLENIESSDKSSSSGIGSTTLLMAILFLEEPDPETQSFLSSSDWLIKNLPRNPYLSDAGKPS